MEVFQQKSTSQSQIYPCGFYTDDNVFVFTKYILRGYNFLRVSLPTHQTQTHWNGQRDRLTGGRITRQAERQKEIGKERLTDKSRLDCRIDGYYIIYNS